MRAKDVCPAGIIDRCLTYRILFLRMMTSFAIANEGITMTTAAKITLAYLSVAVIWALGADWLAATLFPAASATIGLYKGWVFLFLTSILLYALLVKESARRDLVETGLRALAIYDPLTGLLNRACFMENLEKSIARGAGTQEGRRGFHRSGRIQGG